MNADSLATFTELWSLAGWTMVHFLWLGAAAAVIAFLGRLALRRTSPTIRYAYVLACLAIIAAIPPATAAWLSTKPSPRGQGEGALALEPIAQQASPQPTIELHTTNNFPPHPLASGASPNLPPIPAAPLDTPTPSSTATNPTAPGSAGGSAPSPIATTTSPDDSAPSANPRQSRGLTAPITLLPATTTPHLFTLTTYLYNLIPYLPYLWLIGTPLTFTLLVTGLIGTRRLHRASTIVSDGPLADTLARLTISLRITRHVTIAVCERVAAPVLIGIVRPLILLPPAALTGWSPAEIEMVLLHELAHVRRHDNLINLAQRIVESLLFFHPAVWIVSTWVRREREACCDAAVVTRTQQPHAYAELLLNIAARLTPSPFGRGQGALVPRPLGEGWSEGALNALPLSSPMAHGPLRTRIHHILQLEDDPMLITGKSLALTIATLLTAATLAVLYVPKIGHAEPSTTEATENTESKKENVKEKAEPTTAAETEQPAADKAAGEKTHKTSFPQVLNFELKHTAGDDHATLFLNHQAIDDDGLRRVLAAHADSLDDITVSLSAEKGVPYAEVMKVVDRLEALGLKKLALDTRNVEAGGNAKAVSPSKESKLSTAQDAGDWPRGIAFPSPKEGNIAVQLDRLLGLKVVPATKEELHGGNHPLKVIRGVEVPPNANGTVFLWSLGEFEIKSYDDLATALEKLADYSKIDVKFITSNRTPAGTSGVMFNQWMVNKLKPPAEADATKSSSKFPSLEDQKLADLAFKRLGLELEPIGDDDLKRVKALGYDGGLKAVRFSEVNSIQGTMTANDILVGLHAWPTANFKDLAEVLNRDDLAQLNPLKYYVIREATVQSANAPPTTRDEVITGRISVVPAARSPQDSTPWSTAPTSNTPSLTPNWQPQPTTSTSNAWLNQNDPYKAPTTNNAPAKPSATSTATAEELAILRERVKVCADQLDLVKKRMEAGQIDPLVVQFSATALAVAQSELAQAEGHRNEAITHMKSALSEAEKAAETSAAAFKAGTQTYEKMLAAGNELLELKLRLSRLQNSAADSERTTTNIATPATTQPTQSQLVPRVTPSGDVYESYLPGIPRAAIQAAPSNDWNNNGEASTAPTPLAAASPLVPTPSEPTPTAAQLRRAPEFNGAPAPGRNLKPVPTLNAAPAPTPNAAPAPQPAATFEASLTPQDPSESAPASDPIQRAATLRSPFIPRAAVPVPITNQTPSLTQKSALRYDGKDFNEWNTLWRTELSTEKRLAAIKALTAFGANGYGKEAAAAILSVAAEYDWYHGSSNEALNNLQSACTDAFGGEHNSLPNQLPPDEAVEALIGAAKSQHPAERRFAAKALQAFARTSTAAMETLCELSRSEDEATQAIAWDSLIRSYSPDSPPAVKRVREALVEKSPKSQANALRAIWKNFPRHSSSASAAKFVSGYPEVYPLLFSPDSDVRRNARAVIANFTDDEATRVVPQLIEVLNDESRSADHVEAIRALAALKDRARPAANVLEKALVKSPDLRIPAANALNSILGQQAFNEVLGRTLADELSIHVENGNVVNMGGKPFNEFFQAIQEEEKALF
ncbi:MAG: M56 family metallopeptidase [Pirellulales bacterium]